MPELPEVEYAARKWEQWAARRTLRTISCSDARVLAPTTPRALARLVSMRLAAVERIGKNLLLTFAGANRRLGVWSHLGMTGKWTRRGPLDPAPRFARIRIGFSGDVVLYFEDARLFGFFRLVKDADFSAVPAISALGPDPLRDGIDTDRLAARLARLGAPVKVAIMDQALLAGVGNIQASEALHRAGIDPRRPSSTLSPLEVRRLARAVLASFRYTLSTFPALGRGTSDGASAGGDHRNRGDDGDIVYVEESGSRNPFKVYGRSGDRCSRCRRGIIVRLVQAGRSTYFCPACQRRPG